MSAETSRQESDLVGRRSETLSARLSRAKRSYTTRDVPLHTAAALDEDCVPAAGDVVLATVTALGQHPRLESPTGRRQTLMVGDDVVVAYGARYAPDQFEATVPVDVGPCQLVAAGGIAGSVQVANAAMRPATSLTPAGVLLDASGARLKLRPSARVAAAPGRSVLGADEPLPVRAGLHSDTAAQMVTMVVVGSSMNSGKTTSAAHLVQGLNRAGVRVGAVKVTGTGAGGDRWLLQDSGAEPVLDFTDAGLASTYLVPHEDLVVTFHQLRETLRRAGCQVAVVEIADGLLQQETSCLLEDRRITRVVDGLLFATVDALSAITGLRWLSDRGLSPLAVTGVVSASPLASREARAATGVDVWQMAHLADPGLALALFLTLSQPMGRDGAAASVLDRRRTQAPGRSGRPGPDQQEVHDLVVAGAAG